MKHIKLLSTAVIAAFAFTMPVMAADKEKAPTKEAVKGVDKEGGKGEKKAEAGRAATFRGEVSAVDKDAKTFTITHKTGDKVYAVSADTKITKKGAPATFEDIAAKEYVTGSAMKDGDKLVAKMVTLGGEKPAKGEKKAEVKGGDKPAEKAPAKK